MLAKERVPISKIRFTLSFKSKKTYAKTLIHNMCAATRAKNTPDEQTTFEELLDLGNTNKSLGGRFALDVCELSSKIIGCYMQHPLELRLAQEYAKLIFYIDATYNITKYGLAAIPPVSIDCFNLTCPLGMALVESESHYCVEKVLETFSLEHEGSVCLTDRGSAWEKPLKKHQITHLFDTWHFARDIQTASTAHHEQFRGDMTVAIFEIFPDNNQLLAHIDAIKSYATGQGLTLVTFLKENVDRLCLTHTSKNFLGSIRGSSSRSEGYMSVIKAKGTLKKEMEGWSLLDLFSRHNMLIKDYEINVEIEFNKMIKKDLKWSLFMDEAFTEAGRELLRSNYKIISQHTIEQAEIFNLQLSKPKQPIEHMTVHIPTTGYSTCTCRLFTSLFTPCACMAFVFTQIDTEKRKFMDVNNLHPHWDVTRHPLYTDIMTKLGLPPRRQPSATGSMKDKGPTVEQGHIPIDDPLKRMAKIKFPSKVKDRKSKLNDITKGIFDKAMKDALSYKKAVLALNDLNVSLSKLSMNDVPLTSTGGTLAMPKTRKGKKVVRVHSSLLRKDSTSTNNVLLAGGNRTDALNSSIPPSATTTTVNINNSESKKRDNDSDRGTVIDGGLPSQQQLHAVGISTKTVADQNLLVDDSESVASSSSSSSSSIRPTIVEKEDIAIGDRLQYYQSPGIFGDPRYLVDSCISSITYDDEEGEFSLLMSNLDLIYYDKKICKVKTDVSTMTWRCFNENNYNVQTKEDGKLSSSSALSVNTRYQTKKQNTRTQTNASSLTNIDSPHKKKKHKQSFSPFKSLNKGKATEKAAASDMAEQGSMEDRQVPSVLRLVSKDHTVRHQKKEEIDLTKDLQQNDNEVSTGAWNNKQSYMKWSFTYKDVKYTNSCPLDSVLQILNYIDRDFSLPKTSTLQNVFDLLLTKKYDDARGLYLTTVLSKKIAINSTGKVDLWSSCLDYIHGIEWFKWKRKTEKYSTECKCNRKSLMSVKELFDVSFHVNKKVDTNFGDCSITSYYEREEPTKCQDCNCTIYRKRSPISFPQVMYINASGIRVRSVSKAIIFGEIQYDLVGLIYWIESSHFYSEYRKGSTLYMYDGLRGIQVNQEKESSDYHEVNEKYSLDSLFYVRRECRKPYMY
jgi:hypothetical protein